MKKWNLSVSDLGSWGVDALTLQPAFFWSDISLLSEGLGQCRQVPPNLSQCSDAI
jgi:hypothetical protein